MNTELIIYDFDGVMTDNHVYVTDAIIGHGGGHEFVQCNRDDGFGIDRLRTAGVTQIICTEEKNAVVKNRAAKIGIEAYTGIRDKAVFVAKFCEQHRFNLSNVAYVGNGLNDVKAMLLVGVCFCPKDAHPDVIDIADVVLEVNGGDGVILTLWEYLKKLR